MSNQQCPAVNFPSEMRIKSKELTALKYAAQEISNLLQNQLPALEKIDENLLEVSKIIENFNDEVSKEFSNLFLNQMETLVIARKANIEILYQKINLIKEFIQKKEEQLNEAKLRILERHIKLSENLVEQHEKYLRNLDAPAYHLLENIYPHEVQERFSFISVPVQKKLVGHTIVSANARNIAFREKLDDANKSIESFLDEREGFYDELEDSSTELEPGIYSLPYYLVEVEDIDTGNKRIEVYFPFELDEESTFSDTQTLQSLKEDAISIEIDEKEKTNNFKSLTDYLIENTDLPSSEIERLINDCKYSNI